ncbi:MAG TPA: hypothetical protein VG603_03535 [Chitinophagales bacterium]|nr:hypothetical protein [Chitinophagales bacterium]
MRELRFTPAKKIRPETIETTCAALGLELTMKGTLKSIAANTHWHYKPGKQPGVLEITLITNTGEVILNCKRNREGDWVENAIGAIQKKLAG